MTESSIQVIKDYARSLEVQERFREVVGKSSAGIYIQAALLAVASSDKLLECTPQSIFSSALRAATLQLLVDPSIGHAYLVPYKKSATMIIGYKGLYHLAMRTGEYHYINVSEINEGESIFTDKISGEITIDGDSTSGVIVGYLGAFQLRNGFKKQIYMTVQEIHEHAKRYSPYYSYPSSKWQTDPRPMERKTVLRRLISQWGYLDPADQMALSKTDMDSDVIDAELSDMPSPDEVTPAPPPYYKNFTAEQHLAELGFEADEQPPSNNGHEPVKEAEFAPLMSLETAKAVKTSQGDRYGDLDRKAWEAMKRNITKMMYGNDDDDDDRLTPEQRDEYQYKLDALAVLLNS